MKACKVVLFFVIILFISCRNSALLQPNTLYDGVSIDLPQNWTLAIKWPSAEELLLSKFIGEKDSLTGLNIHVYDYSGRNAHSDSFWVDNQVEIQMNRNLTTQIVKKGIKLINDEKVGFIQYYTSGDSTLHFGETIVKMRYGKLFVIDIFSYSKGPEDFQVQCSSIVNTISFRHMHRKESAEN